MQNFPRFLKALLIILSITLLSGMLTAQDKPKGNCFLKNGDRWGFFGDSITDFNVYPRVIEKVFRHFHPEADVTFFNNAQGGKQAAGAKVKDALRQNPTVVTVMLGMNDAINADWQAGKPLKPALEKYRQNMTRIVRGLKEKNITVVLMTPTLTDENIAITVFRTQGTEKLLREMARVCYEVAKEEQVFCLPAQEVFEHLQDNPEFPQQRLRLDGVHPSSTGAYRLAQLFWERFNFPAPLTTSKRELAPAGVEPLDVRMELQQNVLPVTEPKLTVALSSPTTSSGRITWSCNGGRGSDTVKLSPEAQTWSPKLPASAFPEANGELREVVISVESAGKMAVFFIDLSRNPVVHMKDGVAKSSIPMDPKDSGKGDFAEITFTRKGKALNFEATIKDDVIYHNAAANAWPWNGDNVTVYLDLRPGKRFGGIGFDSDVFQCWFQPRSVPVFTPGFHPWQGSHLESMSTAYGTKTDSSYTIGLALDGWVHLHQRFDASKLDYVGFDMSITDQDEARGKKHRYPYMKTQMHTFLYPVSLAIIDLNNAIKEDSAISASLYGNER